jgi:hypothetical protein
VVSAVQKFKIDHAWADVVLLATQQRSVGTVSDQILKRDHAWTGLVLFCNPAKECREQFKQTLNDGILLNTCPFWEFLVLLEAYFQGLLSGVRH